MTTTPNFEKFQVYFFVFIILLILPVKLLANSGTSIIESNLDYSKNSRIALIIGNSDYVDSPLKNPVNDAIAIDRSLKKTGFKTTLLLNASQVSMRKAIRNFGHILKSESVGLFYFAGHGMQVNGKNYLIPINADIQTEDEVMDYSVDAGMVLRKMQSAGNPLNIVILDACRNNPFARSFRSSNKGLTQIDAPKGSLIIYATAPGSVAADGRGQNGIFTESILKYINQPNLEIGMLLRIVRQDVINTTGNKQIPWESSSLTGSFYFSKKGNYKTYNFKNESIQNLTIDEEEFWKAIRSSSEIEDFQKYLNLYPSGRFASIAKLKISKQTKHIETKQTETIGFKNLEVSKNWNISSGRFTISNGSIEATGKDENCIWYKKKMNEFELSFKAKPSYKNDFRIHIGGSTLNALYNHGRFYTILIPWEGGDSRIDYFDHGYKYHAQTGLKNIIDKSFNVRVIVQNNFLTITINNRQLTIYEMKDYSNGYIGFGYYKGMSVSDLKIRPIK